MAMFFISILHVVIACLKRKLEAHAYLRPRQISMIRNTCKKIPSVDFWQCCKYSCETRGRFLTFCSTMNTLFEHFQNSTSFKNYYTKK